MVRPGGVLGRVDDPTTSGDVEMSASQSVNAELVASTSAITVTGSVPRAGNRSDKRQRRRAHLRRLGQRARVAILEARAEERRPEQQQDECRCPANDDRPRLHPTGQAVEAPVDVGGRLTRLDPSTDGRQRRRQQRHRRRHAQQHDGQPGDAERCQQRHAEDEQPRHGDGDRERREHDGRAGRGDRGHDRIVHVDTTAALLAEPVDDQQAVVDAETDAQHVDDVDREDRHVTERSCADEHGKRREHATERHQQRHAGGHDPAQEEHHHEDRDRECDRLAPQEVVLRGGGERLADEHVAAHEHLRGLELVGELLDLVRQCQLGVLVEVTRQRHHEQRRPPISGPQRIRVRRPGIGDIDHTLEGSDRSDPGRDRSLYFRIVDVDPVGDDRQLPTGLGQPVELAGDPSRFGGGPGAEVGRQHRECRTADRCRDDEQHDPAKDDGASASHHETRQPFHHSTAELIEPATPVAGCETLRRATCNTPARALTVIAAGPPKIAC